MLKLSTIFLSTLLLFGTQSLADKLLSAQQILDHEQAEQAMSEGNFAIAYCIWYPMARQGDSKAQFNLGWMYHNGYGLTISDKTAFDLWIKAAEQGYIDAFYALADLYQAGFGVDQDRDIAMGWYIAAAELGHPPSLEILHELKHRKDEFSHNYFLKLLESHWNLLGQVQQIKVKRANVRTGPGTEYTIQRTLNRGDMVLTMQQKNGWSQIGIVGSQQTAWVFSPLIEEITPLVDGVPATNRSADQIDPVN